MGTSLYNTGHASQSSPSSSSQGSQITTELKDVKVVSRGKTIYEGDVNLAATLERIQSGKTLDFGNDGAVYQNKGGELPSKVSGYYREYYKPTQGFSKTGPERVIAGKNGEYYYTPDHYTTFIQLNNK